MALTTVTVHGELLNLDGLTPAVGTITFRTLIELRDIVDNIVYPPATFTATLDLLGEFTIVIPATDNPDLVPASWVYQVYIATDTWTQTIYVQIPFQVGVVELADLVPLDYDPCNPADLDPPEPFDLSLFVLKSGDTMTGNLTINAALGVTGIVTAGTEVSTPLVTATTVNTSNVITSDVTATIIESNSATVDRATLVTPGTAADVWQYRYNGTRVTYANEYACLRVRGIPDTQVPARFMSHNTHDGTTQPTFQVGLSDAVTMLFQVLANGDILAASGLSMLPTAPQPVVFTGAAASAALISDGAATGAPYTLGTTLHAAANRVYIDGAVVNGGGAPIPGGTVLFTVTAAHRPTAWVQFSVRTSTTLSARATLKPNGTLILDQPLAVGATCSFDGANFRKA